MKIILVTLLVTSGLIYGSTPDCKRRLSFNAQTLGADQKEMIEKKGSRAFINALKQGEFKETYLLPLHTMVVTDMDDGSETTIAILIGNLDENDPDEKKIMDAYFSQMSGRSYLEDHLSKMDLAQAAQFLEDSPFVADYVDPFEVIPVDDVYSLGFYVERGLILDHTDAQRIKDVYDERETKWIAYQGMHSDSPEFDGLEGYREGVGLMNNILEIYEEKRTHGVIQAFLQGTIPDKAYELDFEKIVVRTKKDNEVSLGSRIRQRIQQGASDKDDALKMYKIYLPRGGLYYSRTVMADAKGPKGLTQLADLIEWCPALGQYIFDPTIDLEKLVEDADKSGDANARRIKAAIAPHDWKSYRGKYSNARHLKKCITANKLDARGIKILKAPDEVTLPYVQMIGRELPRVIDNALVSGDNEMIECAESWLLALDGAGIAFESSTSTAEYQDKLKLRKDELVKLAAQKKSDAASDKNKTVKPWLTPTKAFLVGAAGIITYFVYDHVKSSLGQNKKKEQGSFDEAYERFENSIR